MKVIFYALAVLMLFSSATCRKSASGPSLNKQLIGVWKYIGKSGGYAGKSERADPTINQFFEFKSGFRYIQRTNDRVSGQGTYELFKVKSIYSGKEDNAIRFSSNTNNPVKNSIITFRNDTLIIAENVYDGFKLEYIRIE